MKKMSDKFKKMFGKRFPTEDFLVVFSFFMDEGFNIIDKITILHRDELERVFARDIKNEMFESTNLKLIGNLSEFWNKKKITKWEMIKIIEENKKIFPLSDRESPADGDKNSSEDDEIYEEIKTFKNGEDPIW